MKVQLPFSGFYESVHMDAIESQIEQMIDNKEEDTGKKYEHPDIPKKVFTEYAEQYADAWVDAFKDSTGLDISGKFVNLHSPKYYNYSTDEIDYEVSDDKLKKVFEYALKNDKSGLAKFIKDRLEPRSGFSPFYSNDISEWGDFSKLEEPQVSLILDFYDQENNLSEYLWEKVDVFTILDRAGVEPKLMKESSDLKELIMKKILS